MDQFTRLQHKQLAIWAADCAERVLHFFEAQFPTDDRPHKALETGREWVSTGEFKMATIRGASLSAHAAARGAQENSAARFAARAAGQAVAVAHVAQHAYGAALYALKAIAASDQLNAEKLDAEEYLWQTNHLPKPLSSIMKRITYEKRKEKIVIKLCKGKGF